MHYTIKQYIGETELGWTNPKNWYAVEQAPTLEQAIELVWRFMNEDNQPRDNYWIEVSAV